MTRRIAWILAGVGLTFGFTGAVVGYGTGGPVAALIGFALGLFAAVVVVGSSNGVDTGW